MKQDWAEICIKLSTIVSGARDAGHEIKNKTFYDTLKIKPKNDAAVHDIKENCRNEKINLRHFDDGCVGLQFYQRTKVL